MIDRDLLLALADARHAWDYGTRDEYGEAVTRCHVAARTLAFDILDARERAHLRYHDHSDLERIAHCCVPENWPQFGDWPSRWDTRLFPWEAATELPR